MRKALYGYRAFLYLKHFFVEYYQKVIDNEKNTMKLLKNVIICYIIKVKKVINTVKAIKFAPFMMYIKNRWCKVSTAEWPETSVESACKKE